MTIRTLALSSFAQSTAAENDIIDREARPAPPSLTLFAHNRANTRAGELKKIDSSQFCVWKRTVRFLLHKIISFAEKMKFVKNTEISLRGTYTNWVKLFSTNHKFQKSNIIMEGSRHPNFMNPF